MDGNLKVWIEVICPKPTRVPDTWSTYQPKGVFLSENNRSSMLKTARLKLLHM
jgi:hypothetical protein